MRSRISDAARKRLDALPKWSEIAGAVASADVCPVCDRRVKEVRRHKLGPELCCKDCTIEWYDGAGVTKESIKAAVLKRYGGMGGRAGLEDIS